MIMKMNLYCILCLFLTVFSSACGNEKIDGNKKKSLRRNVEKQNVVNDIFMSRLINSRLKLQVCDG